MKKVIVVVALLALLSLSVLAIGTYKTPLVSSKKYGQGGVQRVTNYDPRVNFQTIDTIVYLTPPGPEIYPGVGRGGVAPMYPRGSGKLESITWYGYPRGRVQIKTKDIPASDRTNSMFEAWLVDVDTGYRLSLGTFVTGFGGVGEIDYHVDYYLDPYDFVEVTLEPFDDLDVGPGPVVLVGQIPQANYYNPDPKSAKMVAPPSIRNY
jgi:hypothetical protein